VSMYIEAIVMCSAKVHVFFDIKLYILVVVIISCALPCVGVILGMYYTVLSSVWTLYQTFTLISFFILRFLTNILLELYCHMLVTRYRVQIDD
jgi:hypothetical protein